MQVSTLRGVPGRGRRQVREAVEVLAASMGPCQGSEGGLAAPSGAPKAMAQTERLGEDGRYSSSSEEETHVTEAMAVFLIA